MKVLVSLGILGTMLAIAPAPARAQVKALLLSNTSTNQPASGPEVTTGWTASPDSSVTGYYLCWGLSSGQCTNFIDVGDVTNATLSGLSTNILYFFTVVAYDAAGDQAVPSNEIQYMVTNNPVAGTGPAISADLTNVTVAAGASISLQIGVTGSAPFGYQWFFNGTVTGANSDSLILSNVTLAQAGTYQVVVTNSAGSITSALATVEVLAPPTILADLTSRQVTAGLNVSFQIAVIGTAPLSYQWYRNGSALPGATLDVLNLAAVTLSQAGSYQVAVSNAFGKVASSATLDVVAPSVLRIDSLGSGGYKLTFGGAPNQNYTIQYSTNVNSGWQLVATDTSDPFGIVTCTASPGQPTGYFRVAGP